MPIRLHVGDVVMVKVDARFAWLCGWKDTVRVGVLEARSGRHVKVVFDNGDTLAGDREDIIMATKKKTAARPKKRTTVPGTPRQHRAVDAEALREDVKKRRAVKR